MTLSPSLVATADQVNTAPAILLPALAVVGCVVAAFVVAAGVAALFRLVARRWSLADDVSRRAVPPLRAVLVLVAAWIALRLWVATSSWIAGLEHALTIALIASVAWLVAAIALVVEDAVAASYPIDVPDNRHARRVRTQVQVVRRITIALVVVVAASAALLTFPGMSAFGASLLASAGLLSIVAGLAAQSSLASVFAGMQLAFTDAIRVDDVVIVEGEWGKIEEITMTYVVVHIWDSRRLILPSTYFTSTPFQNWTRRDADLLGTVELDVDWTVPVDAMRAEMHRLLDRTDLWDHRVSVLQVTEATGGLVRVRALASAVDAPTLFDLRCYLREGLVGWLQTLASDGLPRTRLQTMGAPALLELEPELAAVERAEPEPEQAEPTEPEPAGPGAAEPGAAEPGAAEPGAAEPGAAAAPAVPASSASADRTRAAAGSVTRRSFRGADQPGGPVTAGSDARLFTGSMAALERSRAFAGPDRSVIEEREQTAAGVRVTESPRARTRRFKRSRKPRSR